MIVISQIEDTKKDVILQKKQKLLGVWISQSTARQTLSFLNLPSELLYFSNEVGEVLQITVKLLFQFAC